MIDDLIVQFFCHSMSNIFEYPRMCINIEYAIAGKTRDEFKSENCKLNCDYSVYYFWDYNLGFFIKNFTEFQTEVVVIIKMYTRVILHGSDW